VSEYGLSSAFANNQITSVDLSNLTTVGYGGLDNAFANNQITSVDLPLLTTIEDRGMSSAFDSNAITSITFSALTDIDYEGLQNVVGNQTDSQGNQVSVDIYFPALTTNSQIQNNSFNMMLENNEDATVHFPFDMQSTMENWSNVVNGFSGTNTTVLFDLGGCEVTFAVTPNSGNRIVVDGNTSTGNSLMIMKGSTVNYEVYNSSYGLYCSTYLVPSTDTATVTVDVTAPTYNTISIDTSVSGLVVTATIDDVAYTMTETGNSGVYTLPIYNATGSSISVAYYVSGGGSYTDVSGTITFNNSNVTETVTMQQATERNFVRPDLTDNGTMGGNSFAVDSDWEDAQHKVYMAVDGNTSTKNMPDAIYEFYNPAALKVSQLDFDFGSGSKSMDAVVLEGSNDRTNWTTINSWSGSAEPTISWSVNSSAFYKYHKLTFTPHNQYVELCELGITATYMG
jgi:hypothetical protein